jgi:hypothetical protein
MPANLISLAHFSVSSAMNSRPIVDEEWLPEPLRQPLTDQARDDVGRAAGRNSHDQTHRPRRIWGFAATGLHRCG